MISIAVVFHTGSIITGEKFNSPVFQDGFQMLTVKVIYIHNYLEPGYLKWGQWSSILNIEDDVL